MKANFLVKGSFLVMQSFVVEEFQVRKIFEIENRCLILCHCFFENPSWDQDQIANANEYTQ